MQWLIFALMFTALSLLCLARQQHHRQVFGQGCDHRRARWLRRVGWGLLSASLTCQLSAMGIALGLVLWLGMFSLVGLLVICLLTALVKIA